KDHTLLQLLLDHGALSAEEAEHDKRRHVVINALGGTSAGVHAEIHKLNIIDGDTLLLCSDGLTEVVSAESIARILSEASTPQDAGHRLVDQAPSLGAPDNVTVIVARYAALLCPSHPARRTQLAPRPAAVDPVSDGFSVPPAESLPAADAPAPVASSS